MKILFCGDMVLSSEFKCSDEFKELCNSHEFRIANLEAPFDVVGKSITKAGPSIKSNHDFIGSISNLFNVFTLANNHIMDFGEEGLNYTKEILSANSIKFVGAGKTIEDAHEPCSLNDKVFVFSICENEFGAATRNKSGTATVDNMRIIYNKIKQYKSRGKVVLCYHGGSEIIPIPQKYIRDQFNLFLDFGVDLVIGHHPHVVQGHEDRIFYSLGNFFFISKSFDEYKNSDWSLIVSYDTETNKIKTHYTKIINGIVDMLDKPEEMNVLNSYLNSKSYEGLSDAISYVLYKKWYPQTSPDRIPVVLHHIRCNAHRNNVTKGLSIDMAETKLTDIDYEIKIKGFDGIYIERRQI